MKLLKLVLTKQHVSKFVSTMGYLNNIFRECSIYTNVDVAKCDIEFTQDYMKIYGLAPCRNMAVHVRLHTSIFSIFELHAEKLAFSIDLSELYHLIESFGNNDTLTLYVDSNELSILKLDIVAGQKTPGYKITYPYDRKQENHECIIRHQYELKLSGTTDEIVNFEYEALECTMDSLTFKKMCREAKSRSMSEIVEIDLSKNEINIICTDKFDKEYKISAGCECVGAADHIIPRGYYDVNKLLLFSNFEQLQPDGYVPKRVHIHVNHNYPIVIRYNISRWGELRFMSSARSKLHWNIGNTLLTPRADLHE